MSLVAKLYQQRRAVFREDKHSILEYSWLATKASIEALVSELEPRLLPLEVQERARKASTFFGTDVIRVDDSKTDDSFYFELTREMPAIELDRGESE